MAHQLKDYELLNNMYELCYFILIMLGASTTVLCLTLWICAKHIAESCNPHHEEALRDLKFRIGGFENRLIPVSEWMAQFESLNETKESLNKAVLLARHWARVASTGWVTRIEYQDGAVGD